MTLAAAQNQQNTTPDRPELQEILDAIVESGVTGITLRVRDERGEWIGAAGRGELGSDALPPIDGHVRIGSNTKTFTAVLALRLVAEGKIALDAPAADYLPEFGIDRRITVRMLLQHTSGVFNFTGEYYPDGTIVPGIPSTIAGKQWVDNRFASYAPEDLVRLALSKPARFEPGTDWSYSNTNFAIVRLIIEAVTARSIAEEMQRVIIEPLGLSGTVQPTYETEIAEPHAHAYYRFDDDGEARTVDVTEQNPSWISSGGDMISTSQDLQTFITAIATGTMLPDDLRDEMCATRETPVPGMGYGLGLFVQDLGESGTVLTHNGGAAGHAALMYATPDARTTMTATLNYIDDAAMTLAIPFQVGSQRLVDAVFRTAAASSPNV
ncbi:serine hydrolase domain-containing protein [Microbacterium sp. NPDC056234]|uniref:serine hydrolase domain-containing protein n=1 Tax=Microbacterium sp. NPDC056234 TaxID=3345757 RepID=UPI0035E03C5B